MVGTTIKKYCAPSLCSFRFELSGGSYLLLEQTCNGAWRLSFPTGIIAIDTVTKRGGCLRLSMNEVGIP